LSVLLVAGFVFGYYLDDVRRDTPARSGKYFSWATGSLVIIAIITSFFIIGSPQSARLAQFDQQKISDLQTIQNQIVYYYQSKEKLPGSLSDMNDPISSFKIPIDPQATDKGYTYEYNVKNAENLTFELCATFNKNGNDQYAQTRQISVPAKGYADNWQHSAGRVCFERTIDKQLYPPFTKTK